MPVALKHVKGLEELSKALGQFPEKFVRNVVRAGLRRGATPIMEEIKRNAPVAAPNKENVAKYGGRRGLLRDSVRVGTGYRNGVAKATIKVGGKVKGGGDAYYAIMVEFGTKAHVITTRKKTGGLYINGVFVNSVQHPGAKAKPFIRPALQTKADAALLATGEYIRERLKKTLPDLDRVDLGVEDRE